ncbi:MAG: hypothetical protein JSW12_17455 [Deltaproteobacteria bacterium]|nr:MAG: hypothetical protein JSW12_17455 [Deltaproteobacteria bacterium]
MADDDTSDRASAFEQRYQALNNELVIPEYNKFCEENYLTGLNNARGAGWFKLHEEAQNIFNKLKKRYHYFQDKIVAFHFTRLFEFSFEEWSIEQFLSDVEKLGNESEAAKKREMIYRMGCYVLLIVLIGTLTVASYFVSTNVSRLLHILVLAGLISLLVYLDRFIRRYDVVKGNRDIRRRLYKLKTEIEGIPKPSRKDTRLVGENKAFVNLIRVAQEDPKIRAKLLKILSLDKFHRESLLNTSLEEMQLKGAPKELVSAISALLDDAVAQRVLEILGGGKSNMKTKGSHPS